MPLHIERDGRGLVTAWLDNAARRNAMDDAMLAELAGLLEAAGANGTRAIVLRGRNGCFCSGRDLGALAGATGEDAASRLVPVTRLAQAFRRCSVPVVAVVEGKAAGLGVSLACWSDLAIAAQDAAFSVPEARAGIAPSVTTASLVEAIGRRHALDLCLTGRAIDTATAARIGLVQYSCGAEGVEAPLKSVLDDLLKGGPQALRMAKDLGRELEGMSFDAALDAALATAQRSLAGDEMAHGLAALREKKLPPWQRGGLE